MKNSFEDIYQVVRLIPEGRVTSYGAIAEYLGSKGGARFVGWAMNACHGDATIPAHRVVNRAGVLTGKAFFGGDKMQELLENEGIVVENDKIKNLKNHYWIPKDELL
ncbi:methylated-DNA-protein-cysteine methyltransferase-like protein [Arcicella aurantiaca]|uniref:Methylated-DNA-protein-cysteine methyltransferase-like protein n=1 Tax=Arcicella aurantiaca TaxID=591202 RepID=A0A316DZB5_9BACT|nr:MGMT family protein [Arcicella aurantiaca]PWK22642.1 methylated-DNA-protein-cysteine methyltransferase-like protein [Arcicella aurantiaca]